MLTNIRFLYVKLNDRKQYSHIVEISNTSIINNEKIKFNNFYSLPVPNNPDFIKPSFNSTIQKLQARSYVIFRKTCNLFDLLKKHRHLLNLLLNIYIQYVEINPLIHNFMELFVQKDL